VFVETKKLGVERKNLLDSRKACQVKLKELCKLFLVGKAESVWVMTFLKERVALFLVEKRIESR